MPKFKIWVGIAILVINVIIPTTHRSAQAQDNRLSIIASTTLIADVVSNVAGDAADVTSLMGYGVDPHSYEPSAQDIVTLDEADLVFINGANFEEGLLPVLEEAVTENLVTISNCVPILPIGVNTHSEAEHTEESHEHSDAEHESDNPLHDQCEYHFEALAALSVEIEHSESEDAHAEIVDSSLWSGAWISGWAFGTEAMQTAFDAILAATPELTTDDIIGYYEQGNSTSFDEVAIEGENVTFTTDGNSVTCAYAFAGEAEMPDFPGSFWSLFESADTACADYRYLLLSPPHAAEEGSSLHFHMRYGSTSFEEIVNDPSAWYPSLYPDDTTVDALTNIWITSAQAIGLYIAGVVGKEVTMTDEEIAATEGESTDEHNHAEEHAEALGLLYEADCELGHEEAAEGEEHEHEHGNCDPHLWTEVHNVMLWTLMARDVLSDADPANAEIYAANTDAYLMELIALDAEITALLESVTAENRVLVTNHETLGYLAHRYGYEVVGTIIPGGGTTNEPSAQDVASLIETIQDFGVPAIFTENTVSADLAQQIADETGASVYQLYSDSLTDTDGPAHTYIDYMRVNANTIATALTPQ
jgi:ABC-type Zn uptake system ZnuABC Zn-binding protein ZnuA